MMQFPLTLTAILERAGVFFPDVEIVSRRPGGSLDLSNYGRVFQRSRALAASLAAAGINRGDRVGSLMWNHVWHVEAYLGVPASGGVLHTLNPRLHPDELAYIVNHGGDRMLIVDDVLLPVYESFRDQVRIERVLVVPTDGRPLAGVREDYEEFLTLGGGEYAFPDLDENEAAVMCYTSGTTGAPKGVVYSHRALVLHSFGVALPDCFRLAQSDTVLPVVPMFHANGWGTVSAAAMLGARLVLPGPNLDASSLLDLFVRERVTRAAGVPTVWLGIVELLEKDPGRWSLQPDLLAAVGGAALPEGLVRRFDRLGIEVRHAWGMTELTPVGTVGFLKNKGASLSADERVAARARQGIPLPFVEVRARDGDRPTPWDGRSPGELQVRGPWVAASYYNAPAGEGWTEDGWFRTGDIVTIDAEGSIKVADRTKDLIKSGGEWISSVDLENALMGHPAVREAAVVAVPHPKWQERPLAAVVLKEGCRATPAELREHLAARFSRWQLPDAFVFLPEIPRTSVGKFQKSRLREMFAGWDWTEVAGGAP